MACLREGYAGGPVLVNVDGEYVREGASCLGHGGFAVGWPLCS